MHRINLMRNSLVLRITRKLRYAHTHDVDRKKNVVYGSDVRETVVKHSLGRTLYERLKDPDRADKIIQICAATGATMTTQKFLKQSVATAEGLRERNIGKGDFILLVGNNSLNMNIALTGVLLSGAVAVPVSYFANPEDIKNLLSHIQPKFFICDGQTLFTIRRIVTVALGQLDEKQMLLLNDCKYKNTQLQCFPDFIEGKGENWESFKPADVRNPKDEVAIVMKSLVEGAGFRGVGLTHSNLVSVLLRHERDTSITCRTEDSKDWSDERILMVQKIIWMSGIYAVLKSCYFGTTVVVLSEFHEEKFMKAMQKYKITKCDLYPAKLWQLYKYQYKESYDLSACKQLVVIGTGIPKILIQGIKDRNGIVVKTAYSLTEMSGIVIEPHEDAKESATGKLVPMCAAKVVSVTSNQRLSVNTPGEICFTGPTLMKKYVNDEKATRDKIDKEGFFHSGDYGYYDEEGNIFIVDKIKQVIRYKNYEVSPLEIEGVLKMLDAVKDCVVSGIPHPVDGYHTVAFVVLQPGKGMPAQEIIKFIEDKLPEHKHLKGGVVFIPKVPRSRESGFIKRSAINKVLAKYRLVLKPEAENAKDAPESAPESESTLKTLGSTGASETTTKKDSRKD